MEVKVTSEDVQEVYCVREGRDFCAIIINTETEYPLFWVEGNSVSFDDGVVSFLKIPYECYRLTATQSAHSIRICIYDEEIEEALYTKPEDCVLYESELAE